MCRSTARRRHGEAVTRQIQHSVQYSLPSHPAGAHRMESVESPPFDPAVFDSLKVRLAADGPKAAADQLCESLRQAGDYGKLFYALLLKTRIEMGILPIPTASAVDLSNAQQEQYEQAIREACRTVGLLFLDAGNIGAAFSYF